MQPGPAPLLPLCRRNTLKWSDTDSSPLWVRPQAAHLIHHISRLLEKGLAQILPTPPPDFPSPFFWRRELFKVALSPTSTTLLLPFPFRDKREKGKTFSSLPLKGKTPRLGPIGGLGNGVRPTLRQLVPTNSDIALRVLRGGY